jgi:hypothetical protein
VLRIFLNLPDPGWAGSREINRLCGRQERLLSGNHFAQLLVQACGGLIRTQFTGFSGGVFSNSPERLVPALI